MAQAEATIQWDDCWNRIGVWASAGKTCTRLAEVVHCQNCDVYADAGKKLLDRTAPDEYRHEWSENLRQHKDEDQRALRSAFVFRLGAEWFALPTEVLSEVTEIRGIHRIPHNRSQVLRGLVNIRGELHLCVSLGFLFGLEKGDAAASQGRHIHERIVVIERDRERYVFPVSEVSAIHRFRDDQVAEAPATIAEKTGSFLSGILHIDSHHAGLLDPLLLFQALARRLR